jgi:hypothetical protein
MVCDLWLFFFPFLVAAVAVSPLFVCFILLFGRGDSHIHKKKKESKR